MANSKLYFVSFLIPMSFALMFFGCNNNPSDNNNIDPALNGTWTDGVQSGATKIYITELKFNNGNFEWTWDDDLQQRGTYDTKDGILTITIENNYGSPQRLLSDYSRSYSINGDTLNWGGLIYIKK